MHSSLLPHLCMMCGASNSRAASSGLASRLPRRRLRPVSRARQQSQRIEPPPDQARQQQLAPAPQLIIASRRTFLGLTALTALCTCCPAPAVQAVEPSSGFSYGHQDGPSKWGGMCKEGTRQSPVDIPLAHGAAPSSDKLSFDYTGFSGATVKNTGHGAQVNTSGDNFLLVGGQQWRLLQFHFHTPSEHSFGGRHAAMEAHLVHQHMETGTLAVVGVMLEADMSRRARSSDWNSALEQALEHVPAAVGDTSEPLTLRGDTFRSLTPGSGVGASSSSNGSSRQRTHPHVHYSGSLTTPPCSEAVDWFVLAEPAAVSAAQALAFQRLLGNGTTLDTDARPSQPMNGRAFESMRDALVEAL